MSIVLNEEVTAQIWLRDYLAADATLGALISGVWVKSVPIKEPLPVVLIDRQSGNDINAFGIVRALSDELFLVRGVAHWTGSGQQDWATPKSIADRLDVLLQRHSETTSSGLLVTTFRESTYIDEQSVSDGTVILHAGGSYRVKGTADDLEPAVSLEACAKALHDLAVEAPPVLACRILELSTQGSR